MTLRIGINGFGRIGRALFRAAYHPKNLGKFEVVHVNNLSPMAINTHLLHYDSVHGPFESRIEIHEKDSPTPYWTLGDQRISWSSHPQPQNIPWGDLGVDVVMECSGAFTKGDSTTQHLRGGAPRVLISAPANPADLTVVYGVNHGDIQGSERVISNASCTTNCLAVAAQVMVQHFKVVRGSMTTVHAYTSDQRLLDSAHKDWRRARSAPGSMIPTTTGAARTVGKVIPELAGKLDGMAVRVPVNNVSLTDVVWELKNPVSAEEVNAKLKEAAHSSLKNVLGWSDEPLVSTDYCGSTYSAVVDSLLTKVIDEKLCKMVLWYDNEVAFSWRMLDVARYWVQQGRHER